MNRSLIVAAILSAGIGGLPVVSAVAQGRPAPIQSGQAGIGSRPAPPRLPGPLAAQTPGRSVDLSARTFEETLRPLTVVRRLSAANLRTNPATTIGATRIDFRPMLNNPQALANVADRLRSNARLAEVRGEILEAAEVPEGLLVRSQLEYALKPGACSTAVSRRDVERLGVQCFSRVSEAEATAALSNPRDHRYIANARQRAPAVSAAREQFRVTTTRMNEGIGRLRAQLADPAQRSLLSARLGAGELQRLERLSDEDLAGEIASTAVTTIEQVIFIPREESATPAPAPGPPAAPVQEQAPSEIAFGPYFYLTGFTLGREYRWKQRVEATVNWCPILDCSDTYYVEAEVGFSYGFGLRLPIQLDGTYRYDPATGQASVTPVFATRDADAAQYELTGLPRNQVFSGKELVAQVTAFGSAEIHLPVLGTMGGGASFGLDFTEYLDGDFADGNFTPPVPGGRSPSTSKVFDSFDLLAGYGTYAAAGVQAYPAVQVSLESKELSFRLRDLGSNTVTPLMSSGQPVPLFVDRAAGNRSRFAIEDPIYNLGFKITPGVQARFFVNLALWGGEWNLPIWFPELAITLPPGGIDFACHSGTICGRTFTYTPTGGSATEQGRAGLDAQLDQWGQDFETRWSRECSDEICRLGVRFIKTGTVLGAQQRFDAADAELRRSNRTEEPNPVTMANLRSLLDDAVNQARRMAADSTVRAAEAGANGWAHLLQAFWTRQCEDVTCHQEVNTIAAEMPIRAAAEARRTPEDSAVAIQGRISRDFGVRFRDAVERSKARAEAARRRQEIMPLRVRPVAPTVAAPPTTLWRPLPTQGATGAPAIRPPPRPR